MWPRRALFTPDEIRRMDAQAPGAGVPVARLMHNAGAAVARAVRRRFAPARTLVICGPGMNGGDGAVAARLLAERGWPVALAHVGKPHPGEPADAIAAFGGLVVPLEAAEASRAGVVIDAAFGSGFTGRVPDGLRDVLLASRGKIVAVDVPSGMDAMQGAGEGVCPAEMTVTFVRLRPGHVLQRPENLCGTLICADIGMPEAALAGVVPRYWLNEPGHWSLPVLRADGHKYDRGHVTIVGGATMTGAARLAARAARRAGAGLVTIAAPFGAADVYRAGDPGVIVDGRPLETHLADRRKGVWICGPGLLPAEAQAALRLLRGADVRVVGDAAVFDLVRGEPDLLRACDVLTPHLGEFGRAFGLTPAGRLADAERVAAANDLVMVLKGSVTIIAGAGRTTLNADAPPVLATAGSGDVLAGIIGGLLAQAMPAYDAAAAGVWLHGRAGMAAMARQGHSVIAEDLADELGPVIRAATATRGGGGA